MSHQSIKAEAVPSSETQPINAKEMSYRRAEAALAGDTSATAPMAVLRLRLPMSCAGCALCVRERGRNKHYRCVSPPDVSAQMTDLDSYTDKRPEWCPLEEVAWAPPVPLTNIEVFKAGLTLETLLQYFLSCSRCPAERYCTSIINSGTLIWDGCEKIVCAWANLPAEPAEDDCIEIVDEVEEACG